MAHTLYIHEPLQDLPALAQYGFPAGSFFSTDLEWVVEDALFEAAEEGIPQVVIMVEAPDEVLTVPEGDIQEALSPADVEDEWEEVPEEEGEFLEAEEPEEFFEEEEPIDLEAPLVFEEPFEEEEDEDEDYWPETLDEAIELTDSATLAKRFDAQTATVFGEPVEFVQEELTPEESAAGIWYGFTMEPTPLIEFLASYARRVLKRLFRSR